MWQRRWSLWRLSVVIALRAQELEPVTVLGDTARLIQVMMSLVDNALTYTNEGGTITLSVETDGNVVCLGS